MRNMSFAKTTVQIRNQTKTVTRRKGWKYLKVGDILQPIVKGQGLKKGETVEKIGGPIRVVSVRREHLGMLYKFGYGKDELLKEGIAGICDTVDGVIALYFPGIHYLHNVTRIEFEYV